jgi:ribosomal protein S20
MSNTSSAYKKQDVDYSMTDENQKTVQQLKTTLKKLTEGERAIDAGRVVNAKEALGSIRKNIMLGVNV